MIEKSKTTTLEMRLSVPMAFDSKSSTFPWKSSEIVPSA